MKSREGSIERVQGESTVIGKGMFKKESDLTAFVGMRVWTPKNERGVIGGFGKSGKFKVFPGRNEEQASDSPWFVVLKPPTNKKDAADGSLRRRFI